MARTGTIATAAALAALAHLAPSTLVLAQWAPAARTPAAIGRGTCRWRGDPTVSADAVALTFDDGPDPDTTPLFLDRLDELDVRATFFVLGELAERRPDLVRETVRRGHEVGLHGHRHLHHLGHGHHKVAADLRRGLAAVRAAGAEPRFFRPPYGQISLGTLLAARRLGLETVLWSAWGREWRDREPASVARRVGDRLEPGTIVLLHDSDQVAPAGTSQVALDALPEVVDRCRRLELRRVTLGELCSERVEEGARGRGNGG